MTHRDVRVSLAGLVAGIVLGAGSLSYVQSGSFTGSTLAIIRPEVLLHGAPSRGDYTQRNVSKKNVPLRSDSQKNLYPTMKEQTGSSSSSTGSVDTSPASCKAVRNAVSTIQTVYNAVVPDTIRNTEIRTRMDNAIAKALSDGCPVDIDSATTPSTTASSAAADMVDNHCDKFPAHTARYTQCVIAEKNGKTYP